MILETQKEIENDESTVMLIKCSSYQKHLSN